jgi:NOL1/NOP2/fmu family ribosome biogenesis protein
MRFYPDKLPGEGFFIAAFRKVQGERSTRIASGKVDRLMLSEQKLVEQWTDPDQFFFKSGQTICAIPPSLEGDLNVVIGNLRVTQAGAQLGEAIREKFIPHHMLAMSGSVLDTIPVVSLVPDDAIRYLQKKEVVFSGLSKGWHLVQYKGHNLGWINALQNRVNNYYPKEMRILKQ